MEPKRPLATFALVAVPTGWVLLGLPVVLGLAVEPFVLLTLALGLVAPAVLLLRRSDPPGRVRAVLRDSVRPSWLLLPAATVLPALTWAGARLLGGERALDAGLVASLAVNLVTATLVVNLWEELAWTGFYQRRATSRWGRLRGSATTAALFAGVHLPLAFDGADGPGGVAANVAALAVAGLGLRLLIAGVDAWSRGSLLTVAVLHASFNLAGDVVASGHDWVRYALVLALGLLVLATPDRTVRRAQRGEHRHGAVR